MKLNHKFALLLAGAVLAGSLTGCGASSAPASSAASSEAAASSAVSEAASVSAESALPDGVYTADPRKDENAKRFETLSYNRALVDNLAVMDASALSMARDNKKRIRVFGLEEPGNVTRALVGDEIGTLVSTAESRVAE